MRVTRASVVLCSFFLVNLLLTASRAFAMPVQNPDGSDSNDPFFGDEPTPGNHGSAGNDPRNGSNAGPVEGAAYYTKSLMITDLSVVNAPIAQTKLDNPNASGLGHWSFGGLVTKLAGGKRGAAAALAEDWLNTWLVDQSVNGQLVPARTAMNRVLNNWCRAADGSLDLTKAPFRLLAIVNRMDLKDSVRRAGELRFVFGLLDTSDDCAQHYGDDSNIFPTVNDPVQFTVIFEYGQYADSCDEVTKTASRWNDLRALEFGTTYNSRLLSLTDKVITRYGGWDVLHRLRTNEVFLTDPWELREFKLSDSRDRPRLKQVPTAQTPQESFNQSFFLASYLNANADKILAGKNIVPTKLNSVNFLGGSSFAPFTWDAPYVDCEVRHRFANDTCNGCHTAETNTNFTHVSPRPIGETAAISTFLTGEQVTDPVCGVDRSFSELAARERALKGLVAKKCSSNSDDLSSVSNGSSKNGSGKSGLQQLKSKKRKVIPLRRRKGARHVQAL